MEKVTPPTRAAPQDRRPRDELDELDRRLLALLRENSRATNQALSEPSAWPRPPVWRG